MNTLKELINSLTKEEVKNFKVITERSHAGKDRKDLRLFDLYRKYPNYSDDFIAGELFGDDNKNAFYRLKNKVFEDVNKSLFFLHTHSEPISRIFQLRELARIFEQRQVPELALAYLKKADQVARKTKDYEALIIVYRHIIRFAQEYAGINPEPYIEAKQRYEEKLQKVDSLDDLIATIKYRIRRSYNMGRKATNVLKMLQKTIDEFSQDQELLQNRDNQVRLYQAISSIMIQNQDYKNLAAYVQETLKRFESNQWFSKKHHEMKLRMLTYLMNAHYKLGNHQESLGFADKLAVEMKKYQYLYYNKYLIIYYNGLLMNYINEDADKGIALVNYIKNQEDAINWEDYPVLTLLNPAILYYYTNQMEKALDLLNQFFIHPTFGQLDEGFQLKTYLLELMIAFDAEEMDVLDYKTEQFKKHYHEEMQKEEFQDERDFFQVFNLLVESRLGQKSEGPIRTQTRKFIQRYQKKAKKSDDLIPYDDWLSRNLNLKKSNEKAS